MFSDPDILVDDAMSCLKDEFDFDVFGDRTNWSNAYYFGEQLVSRMKQKGEQYAEQKIKGLGIK
jgi:hypothetical protein